MNLFVEISSPVLILPLYPLASKELLIVELGKGLKIEVGKQAYRTQSKIHSNKKEGGGDDLPIQVTRERRFNVCIIRK